MIVGLSYNIFNGEEHLLHSLTAMRKVADYINIVVQYTSNYGTTAGRELESTISSAHASNLFDEIYEYTPNRDIPPQSNELIKRRIGLDLAKKAGVTHFMTMDADEYYLESEFRSAAELIDSDGIEASAVPTYLHIKRPIWRSRFPDTTWCSFLTKVDRDSDLILNDHYPVLVDPTRRYRGSATPFLAFNADAIAMRHMNLVRKDGLESKLQNSANRHMTEFMGLVRKAYDTWEYGADLQFPGKPPMEIIEVPDLFSIDHVFSKDLATTSPSVLRRALLKLFRSNLSK
jgi:hypothetical protein